jgi:hypothetical protein
MVVARLDAQGSGDAPGRHSHTVAATLCVDAVALEAGAAHAPSSSVPATSVESVAARCGSDLRIARSLS